MCVQMFDDLAYYLENYHRIFSVNQSTSRPRVTTKQEREDVTAKLRQAERARVALETKVAQLTKMNEEEMKRLKEEQTGA